jgi:hypothetical protein
MQYKNKQILDLMEQPIKLNALKTVRMYQEKALRAPTAGELAFMRLMSPLYKYTKITYVKQPIFYITEGISFRSDFIFRKYKLLVEIDGSSHNTTKEEDEWRDRVLYELAKMKTLRFTNEDVVKDWKDVRAKVLRALASSPFGYKQHLFHYLKENCSFQSQVSV